MRSTARAGVQHSKTLSYTASAKRVAIGVASLAPPASPVASRPSFHRWTAVRQTPRPASRPQVHPTSAGRFPRLPSRPCWHEAAARHFKPITRVRSRVALRSFLGVPRSSALSSPASASRGGGHPLPHQPSTNRQTILTNKIRPRSDHRRPQASPQEWSPRNVSKPSARSSLPVAMGARATSSGSQLFATQHSRS